MWSANMFDAVFQRVRKLEAYGDMSKELSIIKKLVSSKDDNLKHELLLIEDSYKIIRISSTDKLYYIHYGLGNYIHDKHIPIKNDWYIFKILIYEKE